METFAVGWYRALLACTFGFIAICLGGALAAEIPWLAVLLALAYVARAALMRTLLAEPRALLLDEPFSKLDPELRADIRGFVFSHIRKQAIPVLLVSHDASDAEAAGGQIIQL